MSTKGNESIWTYMYILYLLFVLKYGNYYNSEYLWKFTIKFNKQNLLPFLINDGLLK